MEILIYGEIGTEIRSKEINEKIRNTQGNLLIRINSYGGDVFHAVAIHNALKSRGNVEVQIDGICASAATIIALGGAKIMMPANARFMIHNPTTLLMGYYDNEKMNRIVRGLQSVENAIINMYKQKTKLSEEELRELMKGETWMNAEEAKEKGFIDEIIEPVEDLQASIAQKAVIEERARVKRLESFETSSIAAKAIIQVAKEEGKTLEEIKPYLDAIEKHVDDKTSKAKNELKAQIEDYLESGASKIQSGGIEIEDKNRRNREEVVAIQRKMRGEKK